jgi:ribonuclease HI
MQYNKLTIFTDGGSRGNPGPAAIGAVIFDEEKKVIAEVSECIGVTTNNQAEYRAVIAALEKAIQFKASELVFYLDSELVVKQLRREYKLKNPDFAPLFLKIHNLTVGYKKVTYYHIPREKNKHADKLVNIALDGEKLIVKS